MIQTKLLIVLNRFLVVSEVVIGGGGPFLRTEPSSGKDATTASGAMIAIHDSKFRVQITLEIRLEYMCSDGRIGRSRKRVSRRGPQRTTSNRNINGCFSTFLQRVYNYPAGNIALFDIWVGAVLAWRIGGFRPFGDVKRNTASIT